jgi:ribosomal protein L40E
LAIVGGAGYTGFVDKEVLMNPTCKKCGAYVPEDATVCPKCKTIDPFGEVADEAERFREEQVESAGKPTEKGK